MNFILNSLNQPPIALSLVTILFNMRKLYLHSTSFIYALKTKSFQLVQHWQHQGAVSIRKTVLAGMAIPMLKIRRPNGRLIFNMEIAICR